MKTYFTYILYSETLKKFYVGSTNNLQRRFTDHNKGRSGYTKKGIPWTLVYHEQFETRQEAVKRELEIKNRKERRFIEKLIEASGQSKQADNPAGSLVPVK